MGAKVKNYFTFYGFDIEKKETIKLTNPMSKATFINNKMVENINICEEAKKFLKKGDASVYFSKQMTKDKKYGMVMLSPKVKPLNPVLNKISVFVFGYDIDIEKAKELMDNEFNINRTPDTNSTPNNSNEVKDFNLYLLVKQYHENNIKKNEASKKAKMIKDILITCENGEVLTKNGIRYCVLVGTTQGYLVPDEDKMKANPAIWEEYSKEEKLRVTITVDSGISKTRDKKMNYTRNNFTKAQLFDLASQYDYYVREAAKYDYREKDLKQQILKNFKEGSTKVISPEGQELIIKIKTATNAIRRADSAKMKLNPAIWQQYSKKGTDDKNFSVRKLS